MMNQLQARWQAHQRLAEEYKRYEQERAISHAVECAKPSIPKGRLNRDSRWAMAA